MQETIRDRVEKRLEELGLGAITAANSVGLERTFIRDFVIGRKKTIGADKLPLVAAALQTSVEYLTRGTPPVPSAGGAAGAASEVTLASGSFVQAAIQGTVQAGHFRQFEDYTDEEPVFETIPRDREFPHARHAIFVAEGDSMNSLKPNPILPGNRLITIDFEDLKGQVPFRDNMVVVVEQLRDGGHLREWSVKQVELYEDRVEFCPRSTNPKHKPIVVKRDYRPEDGKEVRVLAIVRKIYNDVPL